MLALYIDATVAPSFWRKSHKTETVRFWLCAVGYVQVTWANNYSATGQSLGIDLVNDPDRMLEPEVAAWATVYGMDTGLFTGKKLSDHINDEHVDFVNARKIINGLDQAETIAGLAIRLKSILELSKC
ncbi:hypothetical protein P9250_05005 [Caballeronia sp. LP006]|uniref:hypothetical protein n=1 Tax=Caballeronia sp. LP006 TaxID=3038552 RepID=UPI002866D567|nr:hypothetical protein [Caballeronia sp. LP006]MDR5827221.1 hypothetical protein [Caballeronia sp. LP006]